MSSNFQLFLPSEQSREVDKSSKNLGNPISRIDLYMVCESAPIMFEFQAHGAISA